MTPKKTSANNSLLLRGSVWHIHWNVPKHLRHLPLFRGKKIYSTTLKTGDVYEARKMRDLIVTQFREMAEASATQLSRRAFMEAYAEAKQAKEELNAKLVYLDDEAAFDAVDGLENAFNVEAVIARGELEKADAYLAVIHGNQTVPDKYAITLKDAAWEFVKAHEGKIAPAIIYRVRKASASLLETLRGKDVKLKDITNRQVTRWIASIASTSSDGTRRGYMSALHRMWHWTWLQEHVDGTSPFKGNKIESQGDSESYEDFTVDELQAVLAEATPALTQLIRFGLITGCRIGEIVGLTPDCFVEVDGVHVVRILKGKTAAASRDIPLPASFWEDLRHSVKGNLWEGKSADAWSQRFGKVKRSAIGNDKSTKCFHSFRHMAATAYERAGIEERITSVILGHKNKRGESMSYGLYSAGLSPAQYLEAVNKMVNSPYTQQFLRLFKS